MQKATFLFGLLFTTTCFSQSSGPSVINSSGGSANTGYYQFEWSVGELALVNQMNGNGNSLIVTNGFMQPYTLYPAYNNQSNLFGYEEIKVFPSPASSFVEINFFTKQKGNIVLTFYDAAGKKVFVKQVRCNGVDLVERIPVSHFASGMYALNIELDAEAGYISKKGIYKITKIN